MLRKSIKAATFQLLISFYHDLEDKIFIYILLLTVMNSNVYLILLRSLIYQEHVCQLELLFSSSW